MGVSQLLLDKTFMSHVLIKKVLTHSLTYRLFASTWHDMHEKYFNSQFYQLLCLLLI